MLSFPLISNFPFSSISGEFSIDFCRGEESRFHDDAVDSDAERGCKLLLHYSPASSIINAMPFIFAEN